MQVIQCKSSTFAMKLPRRCRVSIFQPFRDEGRICIQYVAPKISHHDFSDISDGRTKKCFEQKSISFQSAINYNIKNFKQNFSSMKIQGRVD